MILSRRLAALRGKGRPVWAAPAPLWQPPTPDPEPIPEDALDTNHTDTEPPPAPEAA